MSASNPYVRANSLKAWKEEQDRIKAEEEEKESLKKEKRSKSAQKKVGSFLVGIVMVIMMESFLFRPP